LRCLAVAGKRHHIGLAKILNGLHAAIPFNNDPINDFTVIVVAGAVEWVLTRLGIARPMLCAGLLTAHDP
jgi:hypothetical protein